MDPLPAQPRQTAVEILTLATVGCCCDNDKGDGEEKYILGISIFFTGNQQRGFLCLSEHQDRKICKTLIKSLVKDPVVILRYDSLQLILNYNRIMNIHIFITTMLQL